jgi:hypothetical protein
MIYDVTINGQPRKVLGHYARNGFYIGSHKRLVHQRRAIRQNLNWTKGIDPKTSKPVEYDPSKKLQQYAVVSNRKGGEVDVCPDIWASELSRPRTVKALGLWRRHRRLHPTQDKRVAHGGPFWNGGIPTTLRSEVRLRRSTYDWQVEATTQTVRTMTCWPQRAGSSSPVRSTAPSPPSTMSS